MAPIEVPANEQGKIRVFSISLDDAQAQTLSDSLKSSDASALSRTLGVDQIDPTYVEVIRTADLDEIGLAGYLTEGNGAVPAQVDRDRSRLGALSGWVLLVYSGAFDGTAQTLNPSQELTLIGTYDEERPEMKVTPLPSDAAKPYSGSPQVTPSTPPAGRSGNTLMIIGLGILLLILLWWAFA